MFINCLIVFHTHNDMTMLRTTSEQKLQKCLQIYYQFILKFLCIDTPVRSEFDIRLQRLQEKHAQDTPEFKLRVWAKMLLTYIQHSLSSSNF